MLERERERGERDKEEREREREIQISDACNRILRIRWRIPTSRVTSLDHGASRQVDLDGWNHGGRPAVLARRPALVQARRHTRAHMRARGCARGMVTRIGDSDW